MVTTLIVWGALPFVVDHASTPGWRRSGRAASRRPRSTARGRGGSSATSRFPILKPILLILTSLSIIWDFGVFTQPYLLIDQSKLHAGNYLMSIYLFEEGYFKSDFGRGAAISILMLVIVARAQHRLRAPDGANREVDVSMSQRGRRRDAGAGISASPSSR